jgi:hypothetical protein
MGNAGVNRNVSLSVALDNFQGVVISGVAVTGKVMMQVSSVVVAQMLFIQVVGEELTEVSIPESTDSSGNSASAKKNEFDKFVFMNLTQTVSFADRQNKLVPGQYEFPFSFVVPPGYPVSMAANHFDLKCSFSYRLEIILQNGGVGVNSGLVAQQILPFSLLSSPFPNANIVPASVPPSTVPVYTCCVGRGSMTVGMLTPSAFLYGGDAITVSYILRNSSHAEVTAVEFSLEETVRWNMKGYEVLVTTKLFHRCLSKDSIHFDTSSLKKQPQQSGSSNKDKVRSSEYIEDAATMSELKATLDSMKYTMQSAILANGRMTFTGKLIRVQHELIMKVVTPFGTNNPILSVPLIIQPRSPRFSGSFVTLVSSSLANSAPLQLPQELQQPCDPDLSKPGSSTIQMDDLSSGSVISVSAHADALVVPVPTLLPPVDSFSAFVHSLQGSFAPVDDFKSWLSTNSSDADSLTAIDFKLLYEIVKNVLDQIALTDVLVDKRKCVSCQHIAGALMSCSSLVSVQLVQKMAVKCHDKMSFAVVQQQLTPFDWLSVKSCFN